MIVVAVFMALGLISSLVLPTHHVGAQAPLNAEQHGADWYSMVGVLDLSDPDCSEWAYTGHLVLEDGTRHQVLTFINYSDLDGAMVWVHGWDYSFYCQKMFWVYNWTTVQSIDQPYPAGVESTIQGYIDGSENRVYEFEYKPYDKPELIGLIVEHDPLMKAQFETYARRGTRVEIHYIQTPLRQGETVDQVWWVTWVTESPLKITFTHKVYLPYVGFSPIG